MAYRIIGIGNEFRSDDAVGVLVARELKNKFPQLNISESNGDGTELLSLYNGNDLVIIIDAAYTDSEDEVGKIIQLKLNKTTDLSEFKIFSSHSFGLLESLKMGKILNLLPDETYIYLILTKNFDLGKNISECVKNSIEKIISLIINNHFNYISEK